ncbi:MAG: helix-turn-helix transcriptional regulator [Mediterranea sp.]|jgi:DNA-binding CsgD family transcriptional regulator|nr:helix-turn-helix transcriptional regulator [Mediterranea sp.]
MNTLQQIPEEIVDTLNAFAYVLPLYFYIMDRLADRVLYFSKALAQRHREALPFLHELDILSYQYQYLTPRVDEFTKALEVGIAFIERNESAAAEKKKYTILCVTPSVRNEEIFINQSALPLSADENGYRYWLVCVTHTPLNQSGIYIRKEGEPFCLQYVDDQWERMKFRLLNKRERDILSLSMQGYDIERIAKTLGRTVNTIKLNRRVLFRKLGVDNILSAISIANMHKLL